jgi:proteasome accessory factor A
MAKESRAFRERPCGMETEFGMMLRGSPASEAGSTFVRHFPDVWPEQEVPRIRWDPRARIVGDPASMADHQFYENKDWQRDSNFLLINGTRFYLDGGHAETSTSLCTNPSELLLWNRACYALMDQLRKRYQRFGYDFTMYRNNVSGNDERSSIYTRGKERVSFACHENYTTWRHIPSHVFIERLGCGFFPARIPIIGLGKVGSDERMPWVDFQMSQRADFCWQVSSINTTHGRPIDNTRDVPYADRRTYRRLHVICGDSNMLPYAERMKLGLTDCALKMIEDDELGNALEFLDPVQAIKKISRDSAFTERYDLAHSKRRRPMLDILAAYCDLFGNYAALYYPEDASMQWAINMLAHSIECLRAGDEEALFGKLDWITKKIILRRHLDKRGLSWNSPEAILLDCEYSNNDHDRGICFRLFPDADREFFSLEQRQYAEQNPPETRSRWIVEILKRYPNKIRASNYWFTIIAQHVAADIGPYIFFPDPRLRFNPALAERAFSGSFEECLSILDEYNIIKLSNREDCEISFESSGISQNLSNPYTHDISDGD